MSDLLIQVLAGVLVAVILATATWIWNGARKRKRRGTPRHVQLHYHIYFSFPIKDRQTVSKYVGAVGKAGYKYFVDSQVDWNARPPGSDFYAPLAEAMEASQLLLFFVTPNTATAEGQLWEVRWSVEQHRKEQILVPILLDGAAPRDLPPLLRTRTAITVGNEDEGPRQVLAQIQALIGPPSELNR